MFNALPPQIVFQEVPDEVSLAFIITGCPLQCDGCHSQDTWDRSNGSPLTLERLSFYISLYRSMITCIVFFGGEWCSDELIEKLQLVHQHQLKTCLYTGLDKVSQRITRHLDYLKFGAWRSDLGGLNNKNTNQKFYNLNTGQCLNHRFWHTTPINYQETSHAAII